MIKVIDDFCDEAYFQALQDIFVRPNNKFAWFYHNAVNGKAHDKGEDTFQFVHTLYLGVPVIASSLAGSPSMIQEDPWLRSLSPIVEALDITTLLKIKANCLPRTEKIIEHGLHVDFTKKEKEVLTTGILYMNTNNGYTHFEDGTKIKSVANRLITFPCNLLHGGSTCTDESTRVVINFSFYKQGDKN